MKYSAYFEKLSALTSVKAWILMVVSVSLICNVLLCIKVAFTTDRVQTILMPPEINKTFWVDQEKVSKEYMDQMAIFFAQLMYNATPATIEAQPNELLKYVSPELYASLESELRVTARTMRQANVSTWLVPNFIGSDEKTKTTVIEGVFTVTQGKAVLQQSQRKIELKFAYNAGKITVVAFKDLAKINLNQSIIINPDAPEIDPKTGKPKEVAVLPGQSSNQANGTEIKPQQKPQPKLAEPNIGN